MGVFFRTGEGSAVGVSWPVYLAFVLPLQLLYGFAKMIVHMVVLLFGAIVIGLLCVYGVTRLLWLKARHEENRPSTP